LPTIVDLYGIGESTAFVIVREYCEAMKFHLKPLTIEILTKERIIAISKEFEALHGIPYIFSGGPLPIHFKNHLRRKHI
jgi:hypothetical protein